jgi:hypothetical protein
VARALEVAAVKTGMWTARDALAQAERYQPPDDWSRKMKAQNIAQIKAYLSRSVEPVEAER